MQNFTHVDRRIITRVHNNPNLVLIFPHGTKKYMSFKGNRISKNSIDYL